MLTCKLCMCTFLSTFILFIHLFNSYLFIYLILVFLLIFPLSYFKKGKTQKRLQIGYKKGNWLKIQYNSERFEPRWVNVVVWVIVRVCSVVLRTVVGVDRRFDDDGFRSGCRNVSQHQQQSFSGLHYKPGRSLKPQYKNSVLSLSHARVFKRNSGDYGKWFRKTSYGRREHQTHSNQ